MRRLAGLAALLVVLSAAAGGALATEPLLLG